jgi:anti-sigma28 factor (negative regulator of flagellin synthesis)
MSARENDVSPASAMESPAFLSLGNFVSRILRGANMSSINGLGPNLPVQPVTTKPVAPPAASETPQASATDRLELSGASHLLQSLKTNDIRTDKVATVKAQIEAGTYEDDYKLDVATARLLDDIQK